MPDRLTEIEARANAATPGPWDIERQDWQAVVVRAGVKGPKRQLAWVGGNSALGHNGGNDADFIVHSRDDIAWLVAEVKRLNGIIMGGAWTPRTEETR